MEKKVAIVTGSNKGIGFAIVKGLCQRFDGDVYLTSRDKTRGEEAVAELNKIGLYPKFHILDVANRSSIEAFRDHLKKTHDGIDILINNAGVAAIGEKEKEMFGTIIDINYRSILTIQELIYPLLRDNARVINISSDCGHLSNIKNKYWIERLSKKDLTVDDINEFVTWFLESKKNGVFNRNDFADGGTIPEYRVSKVALAALTFIQQKDLEARNISVNVMHPGLVVTDMSHNVGFYSPDQSAETPLYLALDAPSTLCGQYVWFDKRLLDWYDYNADYYFKLNSVYTTYVKMKLSKCIIL